MFDILNAIESYLKFLLFIKFKFYVNNFLFHWWWWWMYNGHDVMIRIQEIKVWGRSRLICSFLSIVFFKELLVHMFFDFDVKIRIQETKYEGGRDSAPSYPFYGLGEVVVRSTLGHVCNWSWTAWGRRLFLSFYMVLEKLLCGGLSNYVYIISNKFDNFSRSEAEPKN